MSKSEKAQSICKSSDNGYRLEMYKRQHPLYSKWHNFFVNCQRRNYPICDECKTYNGFFKVVLEKMGNELFTNDYTFVVRDYKKGFVYENFYVCLKSSVDNEIKDAEENVNNNNCNDSNNLDSEDYCLNGKKIKISKSVRFSENVFMKTFDIVKHANEVEDKIREKSPSLLKSKNSVTFSRSCNSLTKNPKFEKKGLSDEHREILFKLYGTVDLFRLNKIFAGFAAGWLKQESDLSNISMSMVSMTNPIPAQYCYEFSEDWKSAWRIEVYANMTSPDLTVRKMAFANRDLPRCSENWCMRPIYRGNICRGHYRQLHPISLEVAIAGLKRYKPLYGKRITDIYRKKYIEQQEERKKKMLEERPRTAFINVEKK